MQYNFFENVPGDILPLIFLNLTPQNLLAVFQTCKQFAKVDKNPQFWQKMLSLYYPDVPLPKENEKFTGHKFLFIKKYTSNFKKYSGIMNLSEKNPFDIKSQKKEYFETVLQFFNNNLDKSNPGNHVHLSEEGKPLTGHCGFGSYVGNFKLQLPEQFRIRKDEINSNDFRNIYLPLEPIKMSNILEIEGVPNPFLKEQITLEKMKALFQKTVGDRTENQFNYKLAKNPATGRIARGLFNVLYHKKKTNVDINEELKIALQNIKSVKNLLLNLHDANQNATPIKTGKFVSQLTNFFQTIGILDYDRNDDNDTFLKKCEARGLISLDKEENKNTM